jgi:nicotinamidase-related amidase
LLIIDMINCFDFLSAELIEPKAVRAASAILSLRKEATGAGYPIIYVNDNFGEWHSERSRLVERALARPNPVAELLKPEDDDFFITKPQFSDFYAINLPVLLPRLGVSRLILTGIATDICVLFTATDAHMRDYSPWIPQDAVASETAERGRFALDRMRETMGAETEASDVLSLEGWTKRLDRGEDKHEEG